MSKLIKVTLASDVVAYFNTAHIIGIFPSGDDDSVFYLMVTNTHYDDDDSYIKCKGDYNEVIARLNSKSLILN